MLILTRKPGESLYIGDNVKVTIVEIKGNQIRVGIEAPSELRIYREEIYLQILDENKKAAEGVLESSLEQLSGWKGVSRGGGSEAPSARTGGKVGTGVQAANPSVFLKRKPVKTDKDIQKVDSPKSGGKTES
jgi:carbon storage regulator